MLIVPLPGKISWRNPPAVTLLIILINCFVFFFLQGENTSQAYGFRPAFGSLMTSFTSVFLHGGVMHLVGNMVFLWLVGCVLEVGCGRGFYLFAYLMTGMIAAWFFGLCNLNSTTPLVGASGAIAGLMGIYTVVYGKTKIKIFYSLGFFFSNARVPAILLLPFWVSNELFQLFFGGESMVAYEAHIGGLLSGALLGALQVRFPGNTGKEAFKEDRKEQIASLMEKGLQHLAELDLSLARTAIVQALELDPGNRSALTHLFNIDKLNTAKENLHETAIKLLTHLSQDRDAHEELLNIYREYYRVGGNLQLPPDLHARLGIIFSEHDCMEDAAKIVIFLLRQCPEFSKLPVVILKLSKAFLNKGMAQQGKKCLHLICQRYPESAESQIARKWLSAPTTLSNF